MNATRNGNYFTCFTGLAGLSRNQYIEGGGGVVLINVRMNIDYNQTVSEGGLC